MSRRKQAKPQRLKREGDASESGLLWDSGVMESVKTDAPIDSYSHEETHICDKCSAEFFTWIQLSEHHEVCPEDPLVLRVDNEKMLIPQESFTRSSPVPSIESSESSATESTDGAFVLSHMAVNDDSIDHLEEGPDCEEVMELELCPQNKQPQNCSPQSPDTAEPSSLLMSSAGTYSMPTTNVTLEILHSTRVAVAQFSQGLNSCGIGGKAASDAIPVILEHLLALQQQQVHQLKLTEQICSQVTFMNKHLPQAGLHPVSSSISVTNPFPSQGVITPSIFPQSGTMSLTANEQAAVSLSSLLEKSQSPPVQFISAKHTFRDVTGTSVSSENIASPFSGSSSGSSNTDSQTNSIGCTQVPSPGSMEQSCLLSSSSSLPVLPQSPPSNIIFPNPLTSVAATANTLHPLAALIKHRKRKLPNTYLFKAKLSPEEPFFKHKCKFCAKVFGSDSALQIHLRSHTGERPFKCNICGNRFSTKGNLKVHFQRHKDKYPHVQMNPYPVPEYLDNVPTSSGIPYGMSIPSDKTVFSWLDNKPVVNLATNAPISSTPSLATTPEPFTLMSPSSCSSTQSLTSDETKHPADSMQASETSKLQQLVENIDKKFRDSNQCIVCHHVLSCQSALKMHYRIHTGERPYKCKVCGRAFTTKGNLKAHIGIHRENPPIQVQHSCPVCQKKFTSVIVLQQHIRMHISSQIPGTTLVNGLQEMDINVSITERNVDRSLSSNSNDIDDISMDDEEEDEEVEGMEEGINPSKPLILDCNCPKSSTTISSMAAVDNQIKMVDISISPSNALGIKSPTNGLNDSSQLNAKCNLSEKKVENYSEIILNMSEFYSSPSALMSPSQRNSESVMIRSTDTHNRPDSNEPLAALVKKEQSEAAASAAPGMSHDLTGVQARKLGVKEQALYCTAFQQSGVQVTSQNIPKLSTSSSALGLGKTEMNGHIQRNKTSEGNDPQFPVHVPSTYTTVSSPGMTSLLRPAPSRRTPKQHNCNICGKSFSSASALQIHERTHTGEKPFVCSICGRAFTTKGNLKVHMGTHMWNNAPSRRGRRLSVESPMAVLGGETVKFGEMIQKDLAVCPVNVDTGFWNRYATAITSSLATKNNKISVIQSRGISQLHTLTTGMARMSRTGGPINKTGIELGNNRHFSLLIKDSKEIEIN